MQWLLAIGILWVPVAAWADEKPSLIVVDEDRKSHEISLDALTRLPQRTVTVENEDGKRVEYQGVQLGDLLEHCGVVLGHDLRGRRLANYVVLEATDGYRVVLGIAEADPATSDRLVLVAYRKDGSALPESEGSFRLVIPGDKRHSRWLRMLKKIEIRAAE